MHTDGHSGRQFQGGAGEGPRQLDFSRVQLPLTPLQRFLLCCEAAGACSGPPVAASGLLSQAGSLLQVGVGYLCPGSMVL